MMKPDCPDFDKLSLLLHFFASALLRVNNACSVTLDGNAVV
jgi:hypothetical protein